MKKIQALILSGVLLSSGALFAAEVDKREANQEKRIEQGVKSGELTHKEAKHLRKEKHRVRRQIRAERAANGGKLTTAEKRQINKEENKVSKDIYEKKHNDVETKDAK